jgi:hypothetical protein
MCVKLFFVLPNLRGRRLYGSVFNGVAIKLYHGTAISWDGCVVKVILVLWCGKYGLNKLGSRKQFNLAIEFDFLIVRLNLK